MRIVSLVPCITETLLVTRPTDRIVGRTRYCPSVPGAEIVGGVWDPDLEAITGLAPDRVMVDPEEQRAEDLAALEARLPVTRISIRSLDDALAFAGLDASPGPAPGPRLPVIVPIWLRPLRLLGQGRYASALLEAAGFRNIIQDEGYPGVAGGGDDLDALGPLPPGTCLLLPTEPWAFDEEDALGYHARGYDRTRVVDGRDLFWYGARTMDALGRLRALHHALRSGDES